MFYFLSHYLKNTFFFANVFHYTSFRAIAALLTALLFSIIAGGWFISKWADFFRSGVREYTPETHKAKNNIPTMGGLIILAMTFLSAFLWGNLANPLVWVFLLAMIGFGAIGFLDDWHKIATKKGISASLKFGLQLAIAFITVAAWLYYCHAPTTIVFPFFKSFQPDIGLLFIPWAMMVLISCSNAINLTDGLDGLAIGSLLPNITLFSLIAYLAGHIIFSYYLYIPFVDTAELVVVGAGLIGACLGFLWYNAYPAQMFMGDVGSLALGSGLGMLALMTKHELLLLISGGIFVAETLSVIAQVSVFKRWKKRIFKMAPLHHHFELIGWPETKITARFSMISLILCLLALLTLKLR
jgi:phospho-N-acetylmuramoyl-pentapeptide-transferase